jgi:hypothetical protein
MFAPQIPSLARHITLGAAISLVVFGALALLLSGCGTALSASLVECKLNALERLIETVDGNPMNVTPYDGTELVERVKACHAKAADAGQP